MSVCQTKIKTTTNFMALLKIAKELGWDTDGSGNRWKSAQMEELRQALLIKLEPPEPVSYYKVILCGQQNHKINRHNDIVIYHS